MHGWQAVFLVSFATFWTASNWTTPYCIAADDVPAGSAHVGSLHLINGNHVSGQLLPGSTAESFEWQSPSFVSPFQFPSSTVVSIHYGTQVELPKTDGEYGFQLATGDLLFGSLVGLSGDLIQMEIPGLGKVDVDRSAVHRLYHRRGGEGDLLFVGPNGLLGWQSPGEPGVWREDGGHIATDKPDAILRRDFNLPNQARIEFELTWTTKPDFELAIGVDDSPKTASRAYRFDIWENELVVQRETEREANVESLQKIIDRSGPGRIHVVAFLDQLKGRMLVYSPGGERLADLTITTAKPQVFGGIQLSNRHGDIRLERLQIGRWSGEVPQTTDVGKARIHLSDGSIVYGTLASYDAEKREFQVAGEKETQVIAEERIGDVVFGASDDLPAQSVRIVFMTGMKLSGQIAKVESNRIMLKVPGTREQIPVSFDALQSILILRSTPAVVESMEKHSRLEIDGAALHGQLVDGRVTEQSGLVWKPISSTKESAMRPGLAAKVIYKEPMPKPVVAKPVPNRAPGVRIVGGNAMPQRAARKVASKLSTGQPGIVLHLRTGDRIPLSEASIDEQGLQFKSTVSENSFVPHEKIHALELIIDEDQPTFDTRKLDRLLTLPRMQRNNPPTHLLRSVDGDFLRGRLISMNDAQVQVELRLEGKIVRRDRVALIVWLHPEALQPQADELKAPISSGIENQVQAVLRVSATAGIANGLAEGGNRLTFVPEQIQNSILSGKSEMFGACNVDLQQVDQLYIGKAIEKVAAELPYGKWKMKPAIEPTAPKESGDSEDSGGEGMESPLVGKPAPEIVLKTLDGGSFRLVDHKDKVVILDFWASWCGPCKQAMPQIDRVAQEFAGDGVELYAVNLLETPEKIQEALEKLKLSPNVLLDRDGRVADRYGASAIPQTVIIGRDGKVARLFVGGGSRFEDRLRGAVKSVLTGEAPAVQP